MGKCFINTGGKNLIKSYIKFREQILQDTGEGGWRFRARIRDVLGLAPIVLRKNLIQGYVKFREQILQNTGEGDWRFGAGIRDVLGLAPVVLRENLNNFLRAISDKASGGVSNSGHSPTAFLSQHVEDIGRRL